MRIELIVNKPKTRQIVALPKLLSLSQIANNVSTNYTNESKISPEVYRPTPDGKNIYVVGNVSNPQKLYRELSSKGFTLVDSRITQDVKLKTD